MPLNKLIGLERKLKEGCKDELRETYKWVELSIIDTCRDINPDSSNTTAFFNSLKINVMRDSIDVSVPGLTAKLFRTHPILDRWSLEIGGFYNWHCPLNEAIDKAQGVMVRIMETRIQRTIKKIKRQSKHKIISD